MNQQNRKPGDLGLNLSDKAAQKIRRLQGESAQGVSLEGKKLMRVPLNLIDFDDDQYRGNQEEYDLEGLADNIRELGLDNEPSYEFLPNGRYKVTTGEMRTRAYMLNHERFPDEEEWEAIPAIIKEVKPLEGISLRSTLDLKQLSENLRRDEGDIFDIAECLVRLEDEIGTERLKKYLGDKGQKNSKVALSRWRTLAKVKPLVRRDVNANDITDKETITTLNQIAGKNEERYHDLIHRYQEDTLPDSLAKTAKSVWHEVKNPAGTRKAKKAAKPAAAPAEKTDRSEKSTNEGMSQPPGTLSLEAKDISTEGDVLVVECSNGTVFHIDLPESLKVNIERSGA